MPPDLLVPLEKAGCILGDSCVPGHVPSPAPGINGFAGGALSTQTHFAISEDLISKETGISQQH